MPVKIYDASPSEVTKANVSAALSYVKQNEADIVLFDYGLAATYCNKAFMAEYARLGTFLGIYGRSGLYPWDILL